MAIFVKFLLRSNLGFKVNQHHKMSWISEYFSSGGEGEEGFSKNGLGTKIFFRQTFSPVSKCSDILTFRKIVFFDKQIFRRTLYFTGLTNKFFEAYPEQRPAQLLRTELQGTSAGILSLLPE